MPLQAGTLNVDDTVEQVVVDGLTRTQLVMYAGASCDFNPLHTDEVYATQAAGFPSVFGHGMLTMALAGKAVTDYVGDGRLRRFGGRFRAQVWPGDTLTTRLSVGGDPAGRRPTDRHSRDHHRQSTRRRRLHWHRRSTH